VARRASACASARSPGAPTRRGDAVTSCAPSWPTGTRCVLDNCEHVIDAAAALAARLLADCTRVRVLATSREPLQIPGEALQVVAPLAIPREADHPAVSSGYPAVRLLADRAAAGLDGIEVRAANARAGARICRTLDGMPLAIELAAPWLRTLTPAQLAERLDDRFALLTGGSRIALPRHQTLRAVVDWSWNLLSGQERALARRLAVFPSGVTLAAAERVCAMTTNRNRRRAATSLSTWSASRSSPGQERAKAGRRGTRCWTRSAPTA
jgi:predicted ATPase